METRYIGIDNGVTGSLGFVGGDQKPQMSGTPVTLQQDYIKKKKNINRVDCTLFTTVLKTGGGIYHGVTSGFTVPLKAVIERPLVNPQMFKATMSAVRCLEAQLIILESYAIPYMFIDSKEWQRELLPSGCRGPALKKASMDIGIRLFPDLKTLILKQKDADGLLIAEYARRKGL